MAINVQQSVMLPLIVFDAEAMRIVSDDCSADLLVIATVGSLTYENQPHGESTLATLLVDRAIVGPTPWPLQVRYRGGRTTFVSDQPTLRRGHRYLLAFRIPADRPLPYLVSWDEAPADIDLPDAETLHSAWDTMCAAGPVYGVSIDALRGTLAGSQ